MGEIKQPSWDLMYGVCVKPLTEIIRSFGAACQQYVCDSVLYIIAQASRASFVKIEANDIKLGLTNRGLIQTRQV